MERSKNIRLGLFILIGTVFLILAIYFIGSNQSMFSSTFKVRILFNNVSGLMIGNNVRYSGIDVGTVDDIQILDDTTIEVRILIKESSVKYIKSNAIASIGTDGLMGNKLININPVATKGFPLKNGDFLKSIQSVDSDNMLRTLQKTNEDIYIVAKNLRVISERVNQSNTLWSILSDSIVSENIKNAIVDIQLTSSRSAIITGDLSNIVKSVKDGKGSLGTLLTDTIFSNKLKQTLVQIQLISDTLAFITGDLNYISRHVKSGEGTLGTLIMDTTFVNNLNESMINLKKSTKGLDSNMEALKSSILLRRYFRKQAKAKAKEK
jgi:phospholipid/cholesterol/gamma-HCH transport system substrate-binding protein